ncbi:MAG: hypothetical protein PHQ53_12790 [Candidatus Krumholzibacteria bacterium]|nr:hypothetical protein [Candidatus Krumholzibacteria bacterium]
MTVRTIVLKGEGIRKEALAVAAITPGHLIERTSADKFQVHSTASGNAQRAFAVENPNQYDNDIDHAYAADETVTAVWCQSGMEIYALVPAAAPAIVIGDIVGSNGDGCLKKIAAADQDANVTVESIVGYSLEAVDNSAGGAVARLKIEVA